MATEKQVRQGWRARIFLLLVGILLITAAVWIIPAEKAASGTKETEVAMADTNTDTTIKPEVQPEVKIEKQEKTYLGAFTVTAYCSCKICCGQWASARPNGIVYTASGAIAEEGVTVGTAWDVIPEGTHIEIEGLGKRIAQDRPADWIVKRYNGKIIDAYFADHQAALKHGKRIMNVWIIERKERTEDEHDVRITL